MPFQNLCILAAAAPQNNTQRSVVNKSPSPSYFKRAAATNSGAFVHLRHACFTGFPRTFFGERCVRSLSLLPLLDPVGSAIHLLYGLLRALSWTQGDVSNILRNYATYLNHFVLFRQVCRAYADLELCT